eukprot:CAMPEP_0115307942 /NCGR_PEP_ID=MMETSP0270-20121206/73417_1 /TAXON_ID=71861 /ORGANISM="Scrippsiella trochoidea, Strain CCMP3099" /LENGTH=203 /DNA_ID=CAMNT_0002726433 /DNA_START=14 /DNA_END=621 /DNA_ORIENTATION=+
MGKPTLQSIPPDDGPSARDPHYHRSSAARGPQRTYMRSTSHHPSVVSPRFSEHPASLTQSQPTWAGGAASTQRPINKRNYHSPASWVEKVEQGKTNPTATFLDYTLTDGFCRFWKDEIHKEELHAERLWQMRKAAERPTRPQRVCLGHIPGSSSPTKAAASGLLQRAPRAEQRAGRMSLHRMTTYSSKSVPAFWPKGATLPGG